MANVRRTSLNLDFDLVNQAKSDLGTTGTTETVHRALEDVTRRAALERLANLRFDHLEPDWLEKLRAGDHYTWDEHERVE
jgi:Arc/MetJ family transcription regulator